MADIELPGDAVGREIPLGTMVLFDGNGNVYHIVRWAFATDFDLKGVRLNSRQATHARGQVLLPALRLDSYFHQEVRTERS